MSQLPTFNYRTHAVTKSAKQLLNTSPELLASQQRGLNAQVCADLPVPFQSLPFTTSAIVRNCWNNHIARVNIAG